jgi:hypothetical protein
MVSSHARRQSVAARFFVHAVRVAAKTSARNLFSRLSATRCLREAAYRPTRIRACEFLSGSSFCFNSCFETAALQPQGQLAARSSADLSASCEDMARRRACRHIKTPLRAPVRSSFLFPALTAYHGCLQPQGRPAVRSSADLSASCEDMARRRACRQTKTQTPVAFVQ